MKMGYAELSLKLQDEFDVLVKTEENLKVKSISLTMVGQISTKSEILLKLTVISLRITEPML